MLKTGRVKWFNPQKGFGFISPTDGSSDCFVHLTTVERAGLRSLDAGDLVNYEADDKRRVMSLRVLERAEGHTVASPIDAALKRSLAETSRALESAISELQDYYLDDSALLVLVEPGSAPPGEIADILSDLSILYRKLGGTGINFAFQEVHVVAEEFV